MLIVDTRNALPRLSSAIVKRDSEYEDWRPAKYWLDLKRPYCIELCNKDNNQDALTKFLNK